MGKDVLIGYIASISISPSPGLNAKVILIDDLLALV